jgi:hypothetical protein
MDNCTPLLMLLRHRYMAKCCVHTSTMRIDGKKAELKVRSTQCNRMMEFNIIFVEYTALLY